MKFKHGYTLEEIIEAGNERKSRFIFERYKPDVLAVVTYFEGTADARETPATSGYRPAHQVTNDYLTSGEHIYFENDAVFPGESAKAYIKFITPEVYPNCLWVGKKLNINEGSRVVGEAEITEIYNAQLQAVNK